MAEDQTSTGVDTADKAYLTQAGTYGYCAASGEKIGLERLMAMPIAPYAVDTRNEIERCRQTHG